MYMYKLKKQHIIMFTFCAENDFNLIYAKIARFVFLICTNLALNALFFFDESMHKIYLNYGEYNFVNVIPQIIYSSLISLILDIIISFLIITENKIHEIIDLKKSNSEKKVKEIKDMFKNVKIRYAIFFMLTFLLFLLYWYFISAFCAVYKNTQIILLKNFVTSYFTEFLYPFASYFVLALCRKIALKDKNKKRLGILYNIGNL